jgi:hypothetical protein
MHLEDKVLTSQNERSPDIKCLPVEEYGLTHEVVSQNTTQYKQNTTQHKTKKAKRKPELEHSFC